MAYARYFNEAGKSMPKMATLLEADFNKKWFEESAFRKVTSPTFLEILRQGLYRHLRWKLRNILII